MSAPPPPPTFELLPTALAGMSIFAQPPSHPSSRRWHIYPGRPFAAGRLTKAMPGFPSVVHAFPGALACRSAIAAADAERAGFTSLITRS